MPSLSYSGLFNASPSVRHRVMYLFSRLVRHLRHKMTSHFETILTGISPLLDISAPVNTVNAIAKPPRRRLSQNGAAVEAQTKMEAIANLFEVVGVILSYEHFDPSLRIAYLNVRPHSHAYL